MRARRLSLVSIGTVYSASTALRYKQLGFNVTIHGRCKPAWVRKRARRTWRGYHEPRGHLVAASSASVPDINTKNLLQQRHAEVTPKAESTIEGRTNDVLTIIINTDRFILDDPFIF